MKQGKLFWGTLFIVAGILGLLSALGVHLKISVGLDKDWIIPLLLILLGFTFIAKHDKIKMAVIILAGLISGLAVFSYFWDDDEGDSLFRTRIEIKTDDEEEELDLTTQAPSTIPYYNLTTLNVKLLAAASDLNVRGVGTKDFTAKIKGKQYDMNFNETDGVGVLKIKHQKGESHSLSLKSLDVQLNDEPNYIFNVKSGASDLNLDFSALKVKKLKADIAATDANIKFGDKQTAMNAELKFAASSLTLRIPDDVGCLISGNTALVGQSLKGFTQTDENTYVTENFDTAKKKININLSGALADFEVKIYNNEK
jgi:hypothetical protein